jgi:hypothetical protein
MVRGWQLARSSAALGAVGRSSAAASTEPIIYHLHAAKALSERAARGGRTWHPSNPTTDRLQGRVDLPFGYPFFRQMDRRTVLFISGLDSAGG